MIFFNKCILSFKRECFLLGTFIAVKRHLVTINNRGIFGNHEKSSELSNVFKVIMKTFH